VSDSVAGVSITRHRKKPRSLESKRLQTASKNANRRASQSMAKSEENLDTLGDSTGPTGLVVPEMFEKEEAAASSMALEGPLGDDGPPGVVETSTAIGGNSNWSSQDSGSLATTFSMSLASVSAAVAGPEPSDEGMADLRGDVLIAHAADAEGGVEEVLSVVAHDDILPNMWRTLNPNQRRNFLKRRNKNG
jgi:hypothetical protein